MELACAGQTDVVASVVLINALLVSIAWRVNVSMTACLIVRGLAGLMAAEALVSVPVMRCVVRPEPTVVLSEPVWIAIFVVRQTAPVVRIFAEKELVAMAVMILRKCVTARVERGRQIVWGDRWRVRPIPIQIPMIMRPRNPGLSTAVRRRKLSVALVCM